MVDGLGARPRRLSGLLQAHGEHGQRRMGVPYVRAAARRVVRVPKPFMDDHITAWAGWWECSRGPSVHAPSLSCVCPSAAGRIDAAFWLIVRTGWLHLWFQLRSVLSLLLSRVRASFIHVFACPLFCRAFFVNKKHWTVDLRVKGARHGMSRRGLSLVRVCSVAPSSPSVHPPAVQVASGHSATNDRARTLSAPHLFVAQPAIESVPGPTLPSLPLSSIHPSIHPFIHLPLPNLLPDANGATRTGMTGLATRSVNDNCSTAPLPR